MAGRAQAANLTGMLNNIAETVGEMGKASDWTHQNIRDLSAPELDQNDPASMLKYAKYLQANGQQQAAIAMQGRAADATRRQNQQKGLESLSNLRSTLVTNYDEWMKTPQGKQKIQAVQGAMAQVASKYDFDPETFQSSFAYNGEDARNTRVEQGQGQQVIDDERKYKDEVIRQGDESLAQSQEGMDNQVDQFAKSLGFQYDQLDDTFNIESARNITANRALSIQERMDTAEIERLGVLSHVDLRKADDMEIRTDLFKAYQADEISTNALNRIIMGDENRRADELSGYQYALMEAQTNAAAALAGLTEEQTADLKYDLGFKRSNQDLYVDKLGLDNIYLDAQTRNVRANTGLTNAKTETEPFSQQYIAANTAGILAETELNGKKYKMDERKIKFDQEVKLGEFRQNARALGIEEKRVNGLVANIFDNIRSTQFRDNLLAVNTLAARVSPLFNTAMNLDIDVTNTNAVANARRMFVSQSGSESAGVIFDDAMNRRFETARMQDDLRGRAFQKENTKPPTVERLVAMGMPKEEAERIMTLSDLASKDKQISAYIDRTNRDPSLAAPNEQLMELYEDTAKSLKYQIFGGGFGVPGWEWGSTGIGDGVDDGAVWAASKIAMARAAGSGMSDAQVMMAGITAMMPFAIETDDMGVVNTVYTLQQSLEND